MNLKVKIFADGADKAAIVEKKLPKGTADC